MLFEERSSYLYLKMPRSRRKLDNRKYRNKKKENIHRNTSNIKNKLDINSNTIIKKETNEFNELNKEISQSYNTESPNKMNESNKKKSLEQNQKKSRRKGKKIRIYGNYQQEDLEIFSQKVKNKKLSCRKASSMSGIPKSTIFSKIKRDTNLTDKRKKTTKEEDKLILEKFNNFREKGFPISLIFLKELAKDVTKKKLGRTW